MTVNTTTNEVEYTGNGSTTAFAYSNYLAQDSDLVVKLVASNGLGAETLQVLNTDYTIAGTKTNGIYQNGVTVTMTTAPASTENLLIYNDPPITQATDYTANDAFPAETHENALDKLTTICQRLDQRVDTITNVKEWTLHSEQTINHGIAPSNYEFTSIPDNTGIRIVLSVNRVDGLTVLLGGSGGVITSNYESTHDDGSTSTSSMLWSTFTSTEASSGVNGIYEIYPLNPSNDNPKWVGGGWISHTGSSPAIEHSAGNQPFVTGGLETVRLSFDGSVSGPILGTATLYYYA